MLFIDNCTVHPRLQNLEFIGLFFLSPNATSAIQPLDQGVIKALKVYYRKTMVQSLIHAIESGTTATEFKITLLEGLQFLIRAWESVTPATIVNFLRKAGFVEPCYDSDGN